MMYSPITKTSIAAITLVLFSSVCHSEDITRVLRNNTDNALEPENFFEIGLGAGAYVGSSFNDEDGQGVGPVIVVRGSYNWKGFFVDLLGESSDPIVLGYNVYNNENWSLDAILTRTGRGFRPDDDSIRFTGINERNDFEMFGARLTGYIGENIAQFTIKHDISNTNNGTTASALIGRNWQVRNWNFHGLIGLRFSDAKYIDHYVGVSAEEASNSQFTAYEGKSTVGLSSSFGVTYPINENWIFRGSVNLGTSSGQNDSPLFYKKRNFYIGTSASISYVF
jgi:outer membrane protein